MRALFHDYVQASGRRALDLLKLAESTGAYHFNYEHPTADYVTLMQDNVSTAREQTRQFMFGDTEAANKIDEIRKKDPKAGSIIEDLVRRGVRLPVRETH